MFDFVERAQVFPFGFFHFRMESILHFDSMCGQALVALTNATSLYADT